MNENLARKLKELPNQSGVYFHKSADGEIIYIGKAANLRNRVRSYFNREHTDTKTRALVAEISDTDWIETESEIDALFLESEMVKRYMPRYNILLRDDKSAVYVRIPFSDFTPTVALTRTPVDDGAEYIGPFYSALPIKNALRFLRKIFPYYANKNDADSKLLLQLGLIPNPENPANYKKDLKMLARYLRGERVKIQKEIEKEMDTAAKDLAFEKAADLRNKLQNLNELRRQIVFGRDEFMDISKDQALVGLRDLLDLAEIPRRIEAYDISHISGAHNVASMVVATNGVADRREYRKFKISRNVNDDYAALREVITRRLKHLSDWGRPDLVLIDGGIGQLNAVSDLLDVESIPCIGRDKGGDHSRNAPVEIVAPNFDKAPIKLNHDDHIAKLIARLDEEAHRFAVSYHTNLRNKSLFR
ncbi:UvrB/UvrC motif-containing protein [Candidatus Saccharibacteria bacterium]|nr:UvrB/UvrC motif-containing protein [Candidatus Saccharibacteria bacterium]MCL1963224.1 UvrB/UvrC motif-containing protein [Candidatus Saccharibacteria bacterium]